jgi:hypothetical protein
LDSKSFAKVTDLVTADCGRMIAPVDANKSCAPPPIPHRANATVDFAHAEVKSFYGHLDGWDNIFEQHLSEAIQKTEVWTEKSVET